MKVPHANISFRSDLELLDIAALISDRLFAGVPFQGLGERIWDEIPAVRLMVPILGLHVQLGGYAGKRGYLMSVIAACSPLEEMAAAELIEFRNEEGKRLMALYGNRDIAFDEAVTTKFETIDLSEFLSLVLSKIEEIDVVDRCTW